MRPDATSSSSGGPLERGRPPLGPLNQIAIIVKSTENALGLYRHTLGLSVVHSELLLDQHLRLTQIDPGSVRAAARRTLADHPDRASMLEGGERLHHLCFTVDDMRFASAELRRRGVIARDKAPRSGPRGRIAVFMEPATTRGVLLELTAEATGAGSDPDVG